MSYGSTSYTREGDGPWLETYIPDYTGEANFRVEASDNRGASYASNGLRWTDQADASRWAHGLAMRWFGATNIRVVRESDDAVMEQVL